MPMNSETLQQKRFLGATCFLEVVIHFFIKKSSDQITVKRGSALRLVIEGNPKTQ